MRRNMIVNLLAIFTIVSLALERVGAVNVALQSRGATCRASSEPVACERALDGITAPNGHEWIANQEGIGAWFEIEFADIFEINYLRIMPNCGIGERFKTLLLTFDGAISQKVTLSKESTANWLNCPNSVWDEFPINNICSRKVHIEALSVYTSYNNGFLEVEVHSDRMCLNNNVASRRMAATCSASSEYNVDYGCEKAIDGYAVTGRNGWATSGEATGAWILITFNDVYDLRMTRLMQRNGETEQFKGLRLDFDGKKSQEVTLTQRNGTADHVERGRWWDEFYLEPVCSSMVRITALTEYTRGNNGFLEIEFYATHQFCGCLN